MDKTIATIPRPGGLEAVYTQHEDGRVTRTVRRTPPPKPPKPKRSRKAKEADT